MTEDQRRPDEADERALRAALRAAVTAPLDEVDWNGLHERIMTAAQPQLTGAPGRVSDWMAAWSGPGIPLVAAALAAAIAALLVLPVERPAAEAERPGFWPVAEALMSNLPEETRRMLLTGDDVTSLLQAVLSEEEREVS